MWVTYHRKVDCFSNDGMSLSVLLFLFIKFTKKKKKERTRLILETFS